MTEEDLKLWQRYHEGDEAAQQELILQYLPLAKFWAQKISRSAGWANWEDLRQDGVIGLMRALERFDPQQGVAFKNFARQSICGAIYDSSELTRDVARLQAERCHKIKAAEHELTQTFERLPTIEEVAEKTALTVDQINMAVDAMRIAFAGEYPDTEEVSASSGLQIPNPERAAILQDALATLSREDQEIIWLYYWDGLLDKEIADRLGVSASTAAKRRERALDRLRERLEINKRGGHDEAGQSGK